MICLVFLVSRFRKELISIQTGRPVNVKMRPGFSSFINLLRVKSLTRQIKITELLQKICLYSGGDVYYLVGSD